MFYRKEQEQILSAAYVEGMGYTLIEEDSSSYTYPVDGWIHAENLDTAIQYFANASKSTITLRQAKLALLNAGKLQDVLDAIAVLPEPQKTAAQIEFDYANDVERDSVLLGTIAAAIGLTEAETDQLFAAAKLL